MRKSNLEKINKDSRLYVIKSGNGFSCYGFDVLDLKIKKLCVDLNINNPIKRKGTKKAYSFYVKLLYMAHKRFKETGKKSSIELIPEFIGKEGRKVSIIDQYSEKRSFIIGKSTGFIPCHLEIKRANSSGGEAVFGYPFKSITFLN